MQKLLIVEHSDFLSSAFKDAFCGTWDVRVCADGVCAVDEIRRFRPDAMIINLRLPMKDGLAVLGECFPALPPVILAISTYTSPYVEQAAISMGVGFIMPLPCRVGEVKERLTDMYRSYRDTPSVLMRHLRVLNLDVDRAGYRCLIAAVPYFAEDPRRHLHKEVYPQVAAVCGLNDARCVEHVIRTAVNAAWKKRDIRVRSYYFPLNEDGDVSCPANKDFIARLAEEL